MPSHNLIFILIESFEAFALEMKCADGNYYLPNLRSLVDSENVLYANKITSQVGHGVSIDGQMICNTGLLPIKDGAAAMKYGRNVYPNYASLYDKAILINPLLPTTWNQHIVTYSYGYDEMLYKYEGMNDAQVFETIPKDCDDSTWCYLLLTADSHSPFNRVPCNSSLQFDSEIPEIIQNYLNCLHYTDWCFGVWYSEWIKTEQAQNAVLVITGDHTIFKSAILREFIPYAQKADISIKSGKTYCPLIVQSPDIKENIRIEDICYQMDIYPTILHLIGAEDYYWKGLGVNLLDSIARHNRPITEERAYLLSDKIIRSDYFRQK